MTKYLNGYKKPKSVTREGFVTSLGNFSSIIANSWICKVFLQLFIIKFLLYLNASSNLVLYIPIKDPGMFGFDEVSPDTDNRL